MESNASERIVRERCDPEGEFVPTYSLFLELSVCHRMRFCKHSHLYFIWFRMDDLFSAVSNIKRLAVTEFFMHENEAAIGIHG